MTDLDRTALYASELAEVAAVLDRDGATTWDPDEPLVDRLRRRLVYGVTGYSDPPGVETADEAWATWERAEGKREGALNPTSLPSVLTSRREEGGTR